MRSISSQQLWWSTRPSSFGGADFGGADAALVEQTRQGSRVKEKFDIARPTGGKLHMVTGHLVPDSVLALKKGVTSGNWQIFVLLDIWGKSLPSKSSYVR